MKRIFPSALLVALVTILTLSACNTPVQPHIALSGHGPEVAVRVEQHTLHTDATSCAGRFVSHALPHTIDVQRPVDVFAGSGAGMAIGDLNNDGLPDLLLANLEGPNAIFWNMGQLRFRRQQLGSAPAQTRGVTMVDVDADGLLDIVLAQRFEKPVLWHNTGIEDPQQRFVAMPLAGIDQPFSSITWADLYGRGELSMIAASYDADLVSRKNSPVGVFIYNPVEQGYTAQQLSDQANGLALLTLDLNNDQQLDILVGNTLPLGDGVWLQANNNPQGWQAATAFAKTSQNTMSLDSGDIDNSGRPAIFASDMKPYHQDTATLAQWLPIKKKMLPALPAHDPQQPENVLQMQDANGQWQDQGYQQMLSASGWSWSSKFGDLDNDGWLDLYVVNGMIASGPLDHLPDQELVEPNMAFRNLRGRFAPQADWQLDSLASGRSMSMADLDLDGDLDIVVNNLLSPAQIFENRLCEGTGLLVDLRWEASHNRQAINAQLQLDTSAGIFSRDIRASSGYLSGDLAQAHFGIPNTAQINSLSVRWPDGAFSKITGIVPQSRLTLVR